MPTGYTAAIYEGEENFTFKKFVMQCARNFGALYEMRNEPMDAEIDFDKYFKPSDYHKKELEFAEKKYQDFLNNIPTYESLSERYDKEVEKRQNEFLERTKISSEIRSRYNKMLEKVKAWNPPTGEHINLKNFMISQLEESIAWDCKVYPPQIESREEYIKYYQSPERLLKEIAYLKKEYEREVEQCNKRKQWVLQLIESLKKEDLE